jgi:tetratricopeptide (TPR) repeat protein
VIKIKPTTIIALSIFCLATIRSLVEVGNIEPKANYWDTVKEQYLKLETKVANAGGNEACLKSDPELLRRLANAAWLNGKTQEAAIIYSLFWTFNSKNEHGIYNPQFVNDALLLAGVYQAQGSFKHADECYESILSYDINRLDKTDSIVVRDANNLGVACYLRAAVQKDERERDKFLERSRQVFLLATSVSDDSKSPSLVATIASNRKFLKRDYAGPKRPQ